MVWFKVDDSLAFHAKTVAAGNAAMGLWVRAGSWSAQQLTEGHVPLHIVKALGTVPQANALVRAGLWVAAVDGFDFWQWSDDGRQPTRESVMSDREAARERQKKARDTAKSRRDSGVTNGVTSPVVTVPPSRPVQSRPDPTTDGYDTQSSPVLNRESNGSDGGESIDELVARQAQALYGVDYYKVRSTIAKVCNRVPQAPEVMAIIAEIIDRAHKPIKSPTGLVMTSVREDWAEWQKFLDTEEMAS